MIYISHLLPDSEMKEIVEKTGAGVETIEFSISENLDRLADTIRSYRRRLKDIGSDALILHGPFMDINPAAFDKEVRDVTMKRFCQTYIAAQELGAKKIVYHSGMNPYLHMLECWAERVGAFFQEFMDGRRDVEVVMENVFDPHWEPLPDVFQRVNAPNFHLCLDIGHAHCYSEESVKDWAKQLAPYVTHVHLHDNLGDRDAHLALGVGNLPYEKVLAVLPRGKERTWTVECSFREDVLQSLHRVGALTEIAAIDFH